MRLEETSPSDARVNVTFRGGDTTSKPSEDDLRNYFSQFGEVTDIDSGTSTAIVEFSQQKSALLACKTPVVKLSSGTMFVKKAGYEIKNLGAGARRQSAFTLSSGDQSGTLSPLSGGPRARRESLPVIGVAKSNSTKDDDRLTELESQLEAFMQEVDQATAEYDADKQHIGELKEICDEIDSWVLKSATLYGQLFTTIRENSGLVDKYIEIRRPKKQENKT